MNERDKKRLRRIKREIKRTGNKRVRSQVKKELAQNPDEANLDDVDYGAYKSKDYNGMDRDSKRRRNKRNPPEEGPFVD